MSVVPAIAVVVEIVAPFLKYWSPSHETPPPVYAVPPALTRIAWALPVVKLQLTGAASGTPPEDCTPVVSVSVSFVIAGSGALGVRMIVFVEVSNEGTAPSCVPSGFFSVTVAVVRLVDRIGMSIVAEIFPGQVLALVALFAGDAEVISGAVVVVNVQVT